MIYKSLQFCIQVSFPSIYQKKVSFHSYLSASVYIFAYVSPYRSSLKHVWVLFVSEWAKDVLRFQRRWFASRDKRMANLWVMRTSFRTTKLIIQSFMKKIKLLENPLFLLGFLFYSSERPKQNDRKRQLCKGRRKWRRREKKDRCWKFQTTFKQQREAIELKGKKSLK